MGFVARLPTTGWQEAGGALRAGCLPGGQCSTTSWRALFNPNCPLPSPMVAGILAGAVSITAGCAMVGIVERPGLGRAFCGPPSCLLLLSSRTPGVVCLAHELWCCPSYLYRSPAMRQSSSARLERSFTWAPAKCCCGEAHMSHLPSQHTRRSVLEKFATLFFPWASLLCRSTVLVAPSLPPLAQPAHR